MGISFRKKRHTISEYAEGILAQNRIMLSKAITLVESKLESDNQIAESLLQQLLPHTGKSLRIGITGVPGAGKSTFIESFGKFLTRANKKVAVLTIDPSSQKTHGSILGDKTRMEELSNDPLAYVRPSAAGVNLGGVNSRTRETMLLCEAAGFDVIIIETVGVGQSETSVKGIVDFFLLLMLAGAGDELQGIKRGIMEMADAIAINKDDGENQVMSRHAKREYQNALHMFPANDNGWRAQVLTCSAINNKGIEEIYRMICEYENQTKASGYFYSNRQLQNAQWMHDVINNQLRTDFYNHPFVKQHINDLIMQVENGEVPAITAAKNLINLSKQPASI